MCVVCSCFRSKNDESGQLRTANSGGGGGGGQVLISLKGVELRSNQSGRQVLTAEREEERNH